ncbi:hypothetical protein EDB81DRAFT_882780 [Dactylonectria macrodidyma]|uniref:Uncharacterized protein n=1 Tax=Dactylonectria macrodidyma TaxID=307937 RepID=A0A9P9J9P1_9HYPO|nr:hypothetical protein EDB81DRAFT_882780 [Dactylonectria macrodidyma]
MDGVSLVSLAKLAETAHSQVLHLSNELRSGLERIESANNTAIFITNNYENAQATFKSLRYWLAKADAEAQNAHTLCTEIAKIFSQKADADKPASLKKLEELVDETAEAVKEAKELGSKVVSACKTLKEISDASKEE